MKFIAIFALVAVAAAQIAPEDEDAAFNDYLVSLSDAISVEESEKINFLLDTTRPDTKSALVDRTTSRDARELLSNEQMKSRSTTGNSDRVKPATSSQLISTRA